MYDWRPVTVTLPDRDLLARLVAFPSVSGADHDDAIIEFVCNYLDWPGLSIELVPSADGTRRNVLITAGTLRDDRKGLILCGHLDVVPADEPNWSSDPFVLTERDGSLFGRGSCDMKPFVAMAMNQLVAASTRTLKRPLVGVFTFDEEVGAIGAQEFAKAMRSRPPLPLDCVIGEPTSLRAVRMHKGHLKLRVTITGKPAHSGSPHLGVNAIEAAGELVTKLTALAREFADFRNAQSEFFRSVPFPVLCTAKIHGGEAVNVVPERCVIDLGVRLLPGMRSEDAITKVNHIVRTIDHPARAELSIVNDNPPMLLEHGSELVSALRSLSGMSDDIGVSYATDGGPLQRDLGLRCVLFGPGTIEVAHRPDEHVPIAEFEDCSSIISKIVHRWCDA